LRRGKRRHARCGTGDDGYLSFELAPWSFLLEAARHADGLPGYPIGSIGGQEDDRRRDVARLAEAAERGVAEQPLAELGAEDAGVVRALGLGGAGIDRVDSDLA